MISLYYNWYQLNDNGVWFKPESGRYDARGFILFCLAVHKARLMPDRDTVVMVTSERGYKLRLSDHSETEQNAIIDAISPSIVEL